MMWLLNDRYIWPAVMLTCAHFTARLPRPLAGCATVRLCQGMGFAVDGVHQMLCISGDLLRGQTGRAHVQAGNMAHLLNHSCEPNCYSRLTDVYDDGIGGPKEHVILYAKREIAAFEELTYDYRRDLCGPSTCIHLICSLFLRTAVSDSSVHVLLAVHCAQHSKAVQLIVWHLCMRRRSSRTFIWRSHACSCCVSRFCSEKLLRCNCGARGCRGFVNAPQHGVLKQDFILALASEVQPWNGRA